jgi:DNA-binding SARP family transcriptional activator
LTAAVQAVSNLAGVDRLQAALYHLANVADPTLRVVVMLRHPDGRIDVQLAVAAEPVEPWTATDQLFWTLDPTADLPEVDPQVNPCPALVQLGVCDDHAELYIDLEAIGILGLTGTPETIRQIARALAATLVISPAARLCRVLTLGFDPYGLDEQVEDRLVIAKSVESLLHEAEMTAKDVVQGVAQHGAGTSFRLRAIDADSGWEPAIAVLAGTALADEEISRLQRLAGGGGQGAAVVCDRLQARWTLELVDPVAGWWQLNPLAQRVRPAQMAADELRELAAYLADADVGPVQPLREPSYNASPPDAGDDEARVPADETDPLPAVPEPVSGYVEPDWLVMIRLFGPPHAINRNGVVLGAAGRGAPLEMLAWLVTHRDKATRTGAKEALWGGDDVKARTVTNAIYGAGALLRGLTDEPSDEFIPGFNERLTLNRLVVSDYELVAHRLAFARRQNDPSVAAEVLAGGLDLVRGVPLAGVEWLWADDNHLSSNLAMIGAALATELAVLRLQGGQTAAAIDATTVGLEVIPGNEELIRLRMQACIDGGDRRAALTVYEKYESVTAARGESIGPAIAALRNELLRSGRT